MALLQRSRALSCVWIGALLLVAAPCSRSVDDVAERDAGHAGVEADDVELVRVLARLAPLDRHLGDAERRALARTVVEASREYDLPVDLVLAVIEVESSFDPFAVSHVGALGLMQVMPTTGAPVARRLGIAWRGPQTLFDVDANVRIGVAYLRELMDRYASVRAALAAYNWGPGEIDARLRSGAVLPVRYPERVLDAYQGAVRRSVS